MENDEQKVLQYLKSKKKGLLCATMLLKRDRRKREEDEKSHAERGTITREHVPVPDDVLKEQMWRANIAANKAREKMEIAIKEKK